MGCFYAGFNYRNRVNGCSKIGETGEATPASRLATFRQKEVFQCLGYIIMKGETHAQRLFVESYARMKIEAECPDFHHIKNDHYLYKIISKEEKYSQAQDFAETALGFAIEACEMVGIEWKRGTKKYKRG